MNVWDNATPRNQITPSLVTVNSSTFDVVVTFGVAQSNYYVGINGGVGIQGPTGPSGTNGTNGAVGATGAAGATGPSGPAGATGASGAAGLGISNCTPASGSGSAYTCSASPVITTCSLVTAIQFIPDVANTGSGVTLNPGCGVKSVTMGDGSNTAPLLGTFVPGNKYLLTFDGTRFNYIPGTYDPQHSGAYYQAGLTSGGTAQGVRDVAQATPTLYYEPTSVAAGDTVLMDGGTVTCDAGLPAGMPTFCRQKVWALLTSCSTNGGGAASIVNYNTSTHVWACHTLVAADIPPIGPNEYAVGGGSANVQTAAPSPAWPTLLAGLTVRWLPSAANTTAATLTVNSLAAKNLTKCGTTSLAANDLTTAAVAQATYDGTQWQLVNPQAAACGGGGGGGSSSGASTAVQTANGSGGFSDGGCTMVGGILTCGTSFSASGAESVAPGTPASNTGVMYFDSTNHVLSEKANNSATVRHTVATSSCSGTTPVIGNISASGAVTCSAGNVLTFATPATSHTFSGLYDFFECTGTCALTVPTPSAGVQYCARNATGVGTVITFGAIGSGMMYEKPDFTTYGTATTGTLVSNGAIGNRVCLIGKDSTHYDIASFDLAANWTAN